MPSQREALKARLLARAEAAIDDMLNDERLGEKMTFSDIEQVIGGSEGNFRRGALEELIAMQQASVSTCPLCGGRLENKGKRRKQVVSLRGEAQIERHYYLCETCGQGYFPPR